MDSKLNKYTKEVENTLHLLSLKDDKAKADKLKKYIGTNLDVVGLVSKVQNDICRTGFSFYSEDKESTYLVFHNIYKQSKLFEAKNQAFIFLHSHYKHIALKTLLKTLPQWIKHTDNWAHSDSLSKFITRLLEDASTQDAMLCIIKKWNVSKNLWERRQSLVSLYYYARTKKHHVSFELTKELIVPLLTDKEYYVQKAVGWTLRESYNIYPKQTYKFIQENVTQISPTAFTTCLEKMTEQQKQPLKETRKNRKLN